MSPENSRRAALIEARKLLLESGPQAVTLKAVGARVGRTHSNLLHHFGSAAGLQRALAAHLAEKVCERIAKAVTDRREGRATSRDVVDLIYDAFDEGGAGALANWMLASGHEDALDPIFAAIHDVIEQVADDGEEKRLIREMTMMMVLPAMGNAMIGSQLASALALERDRSREMIAEELKRRLPRGYEA